MNNLREDKMTTNEPHQPARVVGNQVIWEMSVDMTKLLPNQSPEQPPLALAVPLSRFTPRVGGGSAFLLGLQEHMPQNQHRHFGFQAEFYCWFSVFLRGWRVTLLRIICSQISASICLQPQVGFCA